MDNNNLDKKLQGFQLIAQEKLQAIICSIPGKKDLILEPSLIKPLEHICAASWLKLKGIQKIYKFDAGNIISRAADQVHIFMIRSNLETFQRVLRHIHELERQQPSDIDAAIRNFHFICVPSCFACFKYVLEEEGLYGLVQLHRYNWDFIYIDEGVMSMEVPDVFPTIFFRKDPSLLPAIAQSIRILQMIFGRPDLFLTFGENAQNLLKIMETLGPWTSAENAVTPNFSAVVILDRDKDYASPLLTPAIYSGLLMEVFQSRCGEIQIEGETNKILSQKLEIFMLPKNKKNLQKDTNSVSKKSSDPTVKSPIIRLNSISDEIYGENRYKHFAQASSLVRAQAKAIGLEVQKLSEMKLEDMHDYVAKKLPKIAELKTKVANHLSANEKVIHMLGTNFRKVQSLEEDILNNVSRKRILNELDELLTTDGQKFNTLRLLCLIHLCTGISTEELILFVRNYCNYFGAKYIHVFENLAKAGLLPKIPEVVEKQTMSATKLLSNLPIPKFQQTEFQANINRLKLLVASSGVDTTPTEAGQCPSYVFNNLYIPLAAQLCSFLLKSGSAEEFTSKLGMLDKMQLHLSESQSEYPCKTFANYVRQGDIKDPFPLQKRSIFVYIIGGVTYAEIGACNLVSKLTGAEIIVGSDSIIAGSDLIAGAF